MLLNSHASTAAVAESAAPHTGQAQPWLDRVINLILGTALLGELTVMFANVIARFVFNHSILWADEVSGFALTILTFIGGAMSFQKGGHMSVQALVQRLPQSWKPAIAAFGEWVVAAMGVLVAVMALPLIQARIDLQTPVLRLSQAWLSLALPVGMLLLAYFALRNLRRFSLKTALGAGVALLVLAGVVVGATQLWGPWTDNNAVLWGVLLAFAALLLLGVPIGFVLPVGALLYLYTSGVAQPFEVTHNMQTGTNSFVLLAIPFFILAGGIMTEGGLTKPLANFVRALVGHLRGGLLHVIIVSTYIFSGISGSKVADVVAVGTTMRGMLRSQGYKNSETAAVLASAGVMSETVPPSIPMLVLGSITTLSIGTLFIAGLLPAVLMAVCLMGLVWFRAKRDGVPLLARAGAREIGRSLVKALPALLVPIGLLIGILGGVATPTEVSAIAVVYAVLLCAAAYRSITFKSFWKLMTDSAASAGMVLFIISAATSFSWTLTVANVPRRIGEVMTSLGGSHWVFMLATIVMLVIMGALLEGLPALLIFGPLLMPIAEQIGINPLQYGIVLIMAMGLGSFLPPIGVCFFVSVSVAESTVEDTSKAMLPYIVALLLGLVLLAFVPWFSLVLPHLMGLGG